MNWLQNFYITERRAVELGFTHEGSYYGLPIWLRYDEECPDIAVKFYPLELVFSLFTMIEALMHQLVFTDSEPSFMFQITKEIGTKPSEN